MLGGGASKCKCPEVGMSLVSILRTLPNNNLWNHLRNLTCNNDDGDISDDDRDGVNDDYGDDIDDDDDVDDSDNDGDNVYADNVGDGGCVSLPGLP
ncbi:uncharacterized protein LOC111730593 [Pteropus vampyrus]|uniref:Uncharacterized protein LOC111730593 n=1 Tax=Pteropus vampyrus TaxID=132908 RepID=A0A6P6BRN9_PTEVA|nr:uncharacterized protein LOC111730593 [Pteropus vampyrus]